MSLLPKLSRRELCCGLFSLGLGCSIPNSQSKTAVDIDSLPLKYKDFNFVFVSFDALQAAHVGAWGYPRPTTPTLDALAKRSVRFANAFSVSSWTVPASMTWFTGVYPSEHRMTNKFAIYQPSKQQLANVRELAPELQTLAEVFKENGYATGGFTGNAGVSGGFGYQLGFDVYYHEKGKFGRFEQTVPRALEWVKQHKDQKFFLFLHGYDVHGQCTPAKGLDYRFVEKSYDKKFLGTEREQALLREEGLDQGSLNLREADVRFWRAVYDEKVQRADAQFAKFIADFQRLGLMKKTIFVVTSDHGTELYEHRRFDHGFTLYNELLHVPLLLILPEPITGNVVSERVSSIDIMPTVLELLQIPHSEKLAKQLRGESLLAVVRGAEYSRDLISETDYRQYTYKRALIAPTGWKLIYTLERRTRELYDLNTDPGEMKNLAAEQPTLADELEARLFTHFQRIGHDLLSKKWDVGMNPVYDLNSSP